MGFSRVKSGMMGSWGAGLQYISSSSSERLSKRASTWAAMKPSRSLVSVAVQ
jgi:Holliday junction resolvase-like predicted endonuclease